MTEQQPVQPVAQAPEPKPPSPAVVQPPQLDFDDPPSPSRDPEHERTGEVNPEAQPREVVMEPIDDPKDPMQVDKATRKRAHEAATQAAAGTGIA